MFFKKITNSYVVRLEKGEELISSISQLAEKEKIPGGFLLGLGAVKDATLGYYDVDKKEYIKKTFEAEFELSSLVGDIFYFDGKPGVHAHVTLSDPEFNIIGGHLFSALATATVELFIYLTDGVLKRKLDPKVGLNLLDLS
jgi:predicted DNA-binding protein with PD1-like motif